MAGLRIQYRPGTLPQRLRRLRRTLEGDPAIMELIAEELFRVARRSFQTESSPEGASWPRLTLRYAFFKQLKFGTRPILQATGDMFGSLRRGVTGNVAFVTITGRQAARHQFGFRGTENVRAHTRRTKRGQARVRAHTRQANTPARPFLGFPPAAQKRVAIDIEALLQRRFDQ